jgi:hypothetical protein
VPRSLAPAKQPETLAKREARLRHAIASGGTTENVSLCAEHVRQSQLSILKARRELIRYKQEPDERSRRLESISADEAIWKGISVTEIRGAV